MQGSADETFARQSSESPCRAVCLVNFQDFFFCAGCIGPRGYWQFSPGVKQATLEVLRPRMVNFQEVFVFFFLIAGCNGSLGYWQSLATRESNKQHQWYCFPKESQVPIHYDLSHHNLCMTERMVHKRERRHNNTRRTKARKHQPTTKTNTHNQTQNHRQHRGET